MSTYNMFSWKNKKKSIMSIPPLIWSYGSGVVCSLCGSCGCLLQGFVHVFSCSLSSCYSVLWVVSSIVIGEEGAGC